MVIANIIPPERKRRLNDLGVDYQEVSESIFITDQSEISSKICENDSVSVVIKNSKKIKMSVNRIYFKSKGSDEFIKMTHDNLLEVVNTKFWDIKGNDSLILQHIPTIERIENKYGKGLKVQIWMERPNEKGYGRCKFEVAYSIPSLSKEENDFKRKNIAGSLRSFMSLNGLPEKFEVATGSTVVATRINLSENPTDGSDMNIILYKNGILKIIEFYRFIDEKLNEWNNRDSINLL